MYGPTVVTTARVDAAMAASDSGLFTSACTSPSDSQAGDSLAKRRFTSASLRTLRPASAQRSESGAWRAKYSAVRPPVNPVAPNRIRSYIG